MEEEAKLNASSTRDQPHQDQWTIFKETLCSLPVSFLRELLQYTMMNTTEIPVTRDHKLLHEERVSICTVPKRYKHWGQCPQPTPPWSEISLSKNDLTDTF